MKARNPIYRRSGDEGFSLVEVLAATVILFFVATALLGLAASTTVTATTAKQNNIVINAVNSYIEGIKALDYDAIGLTDPGTGEVAGSLDETTIVTPEGVSITFTPSISWVDDALIAGNQDYKLLKVTAVATLPNGGNTITFSTETQIRDETMSWGWGSFGTSGTAAPPEIEFKTGSPSEGDDVAGGAVYVGALASSPMENGLLISGTFYAGAQPLRNSTGDQAQFTIEAPDADLDFWWDTTATYPDSGEPIFPDGIYQLKIETWDNVGQNTYRVRQVIIDNYPPPTPDTLVVDWAHDDAVHVSWDVVYDGGDPSEAYFVGVDEDTGVGSWVHTHDRCGNYIQDIEYDIPVYLDSTSYAPFHGLSVTESFRRFRVRLYAQSPSHMSGYSLSAPFYSPPLLQGDWTITRVVEGPNAIYERYVSANWAAPMFPVDDIRYRLLRSTNSDMSDPEIVHEVFDAADIYYSEFDTVTVKKKDGYAFTPYYYQLEATFVPSGPTPPAGGIDTVYSNVIGPSGAGVGYAEMGERW